MIGRRRRPAHSKPRIIMSRAVLLSVIVVRLRYQSLRIWIDSSMPPVVIAIDPFAPICQK
jgi:hypothetical protein